MLKLTTLTLCDYIYDVDFSTHTLSAYVHDVGFSTQRMSAKVNDVGDTSKLIWNGFQKSLSKLRAKGLTNTEIAKKWGISTTKLRAKIDIAGEE